MIKSNDNKSRNIRIAESDLEGGLTLREVIPTEDGEPVNVESHVRFQIGREKYFESMHPNYRHGKLQFDEPVRELFFVVSFVGPTRENVIAQMNEAKTKAKRKPQQTPNDEWSPRTESQADAQKLEALLK